MASTFVRATNTGVGFITHEDRIGFTLQGVSDDIYEVSGDYQAWRDRVGGVELSALEATALLNGALVATYTKALETLYDQQAQAKRYDNRLTFAFRAGYAGPYQAEALAFATWMDACNVYGYTQMARVIAAERALPTIEEFIAELPALVYP